MSHSRNSSLSMYWALLIWGLRCIIIKWAIMCSGPFCILPHPIECSCYHQFVALIWDQTPTFQFACIACNLAIAPNVHGMAPGINGYGFSSYGKSARLNPADTGTKVRLYWYVTKVERSRTQSVGYRIKILCRTWWCCKSLQQSNALFQYGAKLAGVVLAATIITLDLFIGQCCSCWENSTCRRWRLKAVTSNPPARCIDHLGTQVSVW